MVILKNLISKLAIFIGALATISCTSAPSVGPSFVAASESGASGALPIALIECPDPVFRFVDDIEWLYDLERDQFDVRSASRTGYSDLGVNKKRVERLRIALESLD